VDISTCSASAPLLGRTFTRDDDRRGGGEAGPVAVISYRFWQQRYGGAGDVIGRSIAIERVPFTIVGVTGPQFFGTEVGRTFDVALPLGTEPLIRGRESALDGRLSWWLTVMVRRKPGQTLEAATTALRGVQSQIREATIPPEYQARPQERDGYFSEPLTLVDAATGQSRLRTRYQEPLTAIMVVVGLVLLIACANIANLLLARAAARRHEISVRLALGASRWRLVRQLLSESLLLSCLGAILGLAFARWGGRLLVRQLSTSTNTVFLDLGLDWRVLGFTTAVAVGTALLFGVAPALRGSKVRPNEALKEHGRGVSADRRFSLGNLLVVAQVALSMILVVAAGLFLRTFSSLVNKDLGFERDQVLIVGVNAARAPVEPQDRAALYERLRLAAAGTPGVGSAAVSAVTPISGSSWNYMVDVPGGPDLPQRERVAFMNLVSPDFFRTLGTRVVAGRDFSYADRKGAPDVIIVNEAFARKFFGGKNPIGRTVRLPGFGNEPTTSHQVVGFVQDAVYRSVRQDIPPTMYFPVAQRRDVPSGVSLSVRAATGSPALLIKPLADSLGGVSKDLAVSFRPLAQQVNNSLIQERIVAILSGFFGGLALLLAGLGLYGVTAYAVSRRHTELGIRMALGADPAGVVRLVLRRVALLVAAGVTLGVLLAFITTALATTTLTAMVYGLEPRDPLTFVIAAVVLASIGALAGWIPARRASRIDPAVVLRQ
jgi:putative ABC transport system permease protein